MLGTSAAFTAMLRYIYLTISAQTLRQDTFIATHLLSVTVSLIRCSKNNFDVSLHVRDWGKPPASYRPAQQVLPPNMSRALGTAARGTSTAASRHMRDVENQLEN